MDLPIEYMLYIIPGIFAVIVVFILYEFKLKEKVHYPLAREQDLGIGRVYLTRFFEGPMTTTDNLWAESWPKIIAGASNPEERKDAIAMRDDLMKQYTFALKDGGTKIMVTCDDNFLDRKYCRREDKGADVPIRSIGPIQDCGTVGEFDGFVWYWAKLDKTTVRATPAESQEMQSRIEGQKFVRLAASNLDENRRVKEENKILRDQLEQEMRDGAKLSQENTSVKKALKTKSLAEPGETKIQNAFMPKVKTWFESPWQIAVAIGAYLVSPLIIGFFGSSIAPTSTAYVTLVITLLGFFAIPFFKKVFGRWL